MLLSALAALAAQSAPPATTPTPRPPIRLPRDRARRPQLGAPSRHGELRGHRGLVRRYAATCQVMRERARYTPARDANGHPVASYDGDYTLTWRLP